ncbi:hypothetical protein L3Q82_006590 [Scortum barcoo]|uniref:Uncharacterized protein n=1 Tax=Scortum barcoo TaxID=214431 RepID=A0ACB8X2V2_9TELE|nr:hypothetical protein L3Q82_006590 [Scortum barcoo]
MAVHQHFPSNLLELERCCKEEWAKLPKDRIIAYAAKPNRSSTCCMCGHCGCIIMDWILDSFPLSKPAFGAAAHAQ